MILAFRNVSQELHWCKMTCLTMMSCSGLQCLSQLALQQMLQSARR